MQHVLIAGTGSSEVGNQHTQPQLVDKKLQGLKAWTTSAAGIGGDLDSNVTWPTGSGRMDKHEHSSDLDQVDGLGTLLLESTGTGQAHSLIPPVVPVAPQTCIPGAATCSPQSQHMLGADGLSLADVDAELPKSVDGILPAEQGWGDAKQLEPVLGSVTQGSAWNKSPLSAALRGGGKHDGDNCVTHQSTDGQQVVSNPHISASTCTAGPPQSRGANQDFQADSPSCSLASLEDSDCSATLPGVGDQVVNEEEPVFMPERWIRPTIQMNTGPGCRPIWAQCGGKSYNGVQCCADGGVCKFVSQWYSQCQPIQSLSA